MVVMDSVSRPLIALLLGTVAFFALWLVALKPSTSPSTGGSPGLLGVYQPAIDKAHHAVAIANGAGAALRARAPGGSATIAAGARAAALATATTGARTAAPPTAGSRTVRPRVTRVHVSGGASRRLRTVEAALRARKVIALLFYNVAAADDRAVKRELAAVPAHGTRGGS